MIENPPAEKGERFVSMRNGKEAVVYDVTCSWGRKWFAHVDVAGGGRIVLACSKDGIKGYRRKT